MSRSDSQDVMGNLIAENKGCQLVQDNLIGKNSIDLLKHIPISLIKDPTKSLDFDVISKRKGG